MALVFLFFIFLFYGSTAPYPSPCCTVPTVLELLPNRSHFLLGIDCGEYPVSKLINRSSGTTDGNLSFILFIPSIPSSHAPSLPPSIQVFRHPLANAIHPQTSYQALFQPSLAFLSASPSLFLPSATYKCCAVLHAKLLPPPPHFHSTARYPYYHSNTNPPQ